MVLMVFIKCCSRTDSRPCVVFQMYRSLSTCPDGGTSLSLISVILCIWCYDSQTVPVQTQKNSTLVMHLILLLVIINTLSSETCCIQHNKLPILKGFHFYDIVSNYEFSFFKVVGP
jgi:hypothetical protein